MKGRREWRKQPEGKAGFKEPFFRRGNLTVCQDKGHSRGRDRKFTHIFLAATANLTYPF